MRTKFKLFKTIICSVLACVVLSCFATVIGINAYAAEDFVMKNGASVKTGNGNGLRFTAILPAEKYESGATYGMLIAPEDYVRNAELTAENVFGENAVYDWAVKDADGNYVYTGTKTRIINVVYDSLTPNADGNYVINGSILSLKSGNIARNFVGRAYKRTGKEGSYVYEMAGYTNGDVGNNTRSMFTVANAAIKSDTESDATKSFLESEYIDKTYTLATLNESDDYVKFFSKKSSENGSVIGDLTETTDIPKGYDKAYSMFAQYGDEYTLFGGVNLDDYIRLKFMIKGTYTAPGIGYYENTEWKEIKCKKNSDGVWMLSYNGVETALQQKMTLSGSICITDLYSVKEDTSAKYYRVTFKDENDEILGYKSIKSGNAAELTLEDKDLGDGYTLTYDNVKWLDSIGGSEVDLSSVTKDMTVYFGGEKITYVNVPYFDPNGGYKNIIATNKYISANGNILTYKMRFSSTQWGSFVICGNNPWGQLEDGSYNNIQFGVDTGECGEWWTVEANLSTYLITVKKPNGDIATQKTLATFEVKDLTFYMNSLSGVDLAAIQGKSYTVIYMDENSNVIGTEKVKEGSGATFIPSATTTDDGYTIEYENVVWLDSVGGDEVDLSSVTEDMTVYFGGEKITYVNVPYFDPNGGYKNIIATNKYISANGNILTYKMRFSSTQWGSFVICGNNPWGQLEDGSYNNIQFGVDTSECGEWWTVEVNLSTYLITVKKPNGDIAAQKTLATFEVKDLTFYMNSLSGVDIAAVSSKKKLEITNIAVLNKYSPSTTSQNEDDRVYKYAVEELVGLYSELTGTTLDVNYVDSVSALDANKKYFVLGSALAEEKGFSLSGLTTDTGYSISKKSGNIYLYGKTGYGTLNALYGVLSQAFNLEFYTDAVYTFDSVKFDYDKIEDTVFNPSIDYNWAHGAMEFIPNDENQPNWNYQHRLGFVNSWQILGGGYHNFLTVLPKETYETAHPNWYTTATNLGGEAFDTLSLAYGLETADNNEMATAVADYVYNSIKDGDKVNVEKSMFVFGHPDTWGWSNSSYSQTIKNKYGAYSAEYILFMKKVAKILDEKYTFGRKIQLTLLAYNATLETPTYSDDLKFYNGDEVYMGVIFAPIESNLYLRLDSPANGYSEHNEANDAYAEVYGRTNQYYYNQLINWQQFLNGGELSVFYYSAHYDNYFVPLDSVTNMGQKYKFFADNGVKHLYNMGQSGDDVYTDWYALKTYMESKYTQDAARTDADELILNFCKAYYGAAGDIMYELYKAEVAQYKVASNYWINQKGADPTGGHLIRKYLFDENCWGGNADLLLGWYEKIENALAAVDSNSAYYNRIKIEGLNIRYLLAGIFNNTSKGTMAEISADAKNLGIDIFAEGNAYTSNGEYGQSGKIEDLK